MPLTRSTDEVARVVALLESDQFDTAEQLAYAVLKEAADVVAGRTLWALEAVGEGVLWGPYYTLGQAEKAWTHDVGPANGGKAGRIVRIAPFPGPPEALERVGPKTPCGYCKHPKWHHTTEGKRLYCGPRGSGCKCTGFEVPRT